MKNSWYNIKIQIIINDHLIDDDIIEKNLENEKIIGDPNINPDKNIIDP